MNQGKIKGKFEELSGKIKKTWDRLSDDDIALANSNRKKFFGKLQETYGLEKEDAEKRLIELEKACAIHSNKAA